MEALKLSPSELQSISGNTSRCLELAVWEDAGLHTAEFCTRILASCSRDFGTKVVESLTTIGGLRIDVPQRRVDGKNQLVLGLYPELKDELSDDPLLFSRVDAKVGRRTIIVGYMDAGRVHICMDEDGRIYEDVDTDVLYSGESWLCALENYCMRANTPHVRLPINSLRFTPPGCPNARWLAARAEVQFGEPIENDPMTSPQATPAEIVHPEDQEWIYHRPTLEDMERAGVHVHRAARRFLDRYSGIRIVHRNPHLKHYVSWGYLGLSRSSLCCLESRYLPALQERRRRWGWPVVVGMIDDFNMELVVNERGDIMISKFHGPSWLLGRSPDAAIDTLLNHKPWERIRR